MSDQKTKLIIKMFQKSLTQLFYFSSKEQLIKEILLKTIKPTRLEIVNESHKHSRGADTHFNMLIVSESFKDLSKVQQHQLVYSSLGSTMKEIHALTMTCYSEEPENPKAWSLGCFHSKSK